MTRRCGVLGSPVAHSLSPTLHRAAYGALGLDWEYGAHDVDTAGLADFVAGLGTQWRGLSLTMPLKEVALGLCDRVDGAARLAGSVNTMLLEPAGGVTGLNTDVPGFVAAWREAGITQVGHAVIVGAGATARSAVVALASVEAAQISVLARSPDRAGLLLALVDELGLDGQVGPLSAGWERQHVDLVVSTVPISAHDVAMTRLAERLVAGAGAVSDVVYAPRLTAFILAARRSGLPYAEGFDLLLHQAARQVELMTGCLAAPLEAMRAAGLAELARRAERR